MAAGTKTFSTQFQIGAKFTGQQAFSQANKALDRTQRNAKQTHTSFTKMFGAVAGGLAAFELGRRAIAGLNAALFSSIEAALDVQKAHEGLRSAVERNFDRWKHGSKTIDEVTKSLIGLAEANEKTGFDAENAEAGFAKLQDSMAPERIKLFSQTFFDITAKLKGANASAEDFAEVAQLINSAVNQGRPGLLRQVGLTKEQIKAFAALKTVEERRAYIAKFVGQKVAGEQARVFKTTTGKIAQMQTQLSNLAESFGKPLVEPMGAMADAFREVFIAMGPVADEFADRLGPEVQKFSQWLIDNKAEITAWAKWAADWALWLGQKFVVSIQDTYAQWQTVWGTLKASWEIVTTTWTTLCENIKAGMQDSWSGITAIWDQAAAYFENVVEAIRKLFEPLYDWIIKPFKDAYDYLIKLWPNIGGAGGGAGSATSATAAAPYSGGARQPEDYIPPWQQTGAPTAPAAAGGPQGGTGQYYSQAQASSGTLASERARLAEEYANNPAVRAKLLKVAQAEVGSGDPQRLQAFMEGVFNRAASRKQTLDRALQADYYDTLRHGPLATPTPAQVAKHEEAIAKVKAGSNVSGYSTGNWSGRKGAGFGQAQGGYLSKVLGGEQFGVEAADVGWAKRMEADEKATKMVKEATDPQHPQGKNPWGVSFSGQNVPPPPPPPKEPRWPKTPKVSALTPSLSPFEAQTIMENAQMALPGGPGGKLRHMIKEMGIQQRVGGATGGTNVAMNPTINVNGVAPGRESLMAKKTALALRDPTAQLLTEIKKARAQENRLGYV